MALPLNLCGMSNDEVFFFNLKERGFETYFIYLGMDIINMYVFEKIMDKKPIFLTQNFD